MAEQNFKAVILGIPHIPTVREVNVRSGPSTGHTLVFKTPLGIETSVADVQPDAEQIARDGKVYQWFKLNFPDGRSGWVRDDLIEIYGHDREFGYGLLKNRAMAFALRRNLSTPVPTTTSVPLSPMPAPKPSADEAQAWATCRSKSGVNIRQGPGTVFNPPLGRMNFDERVAVLGAQPDRDGTRLKWVQVEVRGIRGYVREDYLRFEGDTEPFELGSKDLYAAPMPDSWWVRDFNPRPINPLLGVEHWGWDLGGQIGTPIYAGPKGGIVTVVNRCQRCTPSAPNTLSQGYGLSDPRVLNDPAWGYGYGTYVIVCYDHDDLPQATQEALARLNLAESHLFVMYAHLLDYIVQDGQTVTAHHQIGACGNTGNSEAPHLHLEVRAGRSKDASWSSLATFLVNPAILFRR